MVDVEVVMVVAEVVDSTGIPGTVMLLPMKTDMVEDTGAQKKEMEQEVVGLLVDTEGVVVEASTMVIQVTLNAHVGTLSVTVEQVMGKQAF